MRKKVFEKSNNESDNIIDIEKTKSTVNETYGKYDNINESEKIVNEYKETIESEKPKQRKKKSDLREAESFAQTATLSANLALDLILKRLPSYSPLSNDEITSFNNAFTALAQKYYASITRYSEELNFTIILVLVLMPRLIKKESDSKKVNEKVNEKESIDLSKKE